MLTLYAGHGSSTPCAAAIMKLPYACVLALAVVPAVQAFLGPGVVERALLGDRRAQSPQRDHNVVCMMAGGRTPFIAGNWKMNPLDLSAAKDLAKQVMLFLVGLLSARATVCLL